MARTHCEPAREVPVVSNTEVIVCGGGPAGVSAAISAARAGAKTTLIEVHALGGVWTAGLLSWILDWSNKTGLMEEIIAELEPRGARQRVGAAGLAYDPEAMKLVLEEMCTKAGVRIRLHTRVVAAARDAKNRLAVAITESKSGREAWAGKAFVDATGDGDLAALAGCGFDFGHDDKTQPMTMMALLAGIRAKDVAPCLYGGAERHDKTIDAFFAELRRAGITPSYSRPMLIQIHDDLFAMMANHEHGASGLDAQQITDTTMRARAEVHGIVAGLRKLGGAWKEVKTVATGSQIGVREGRRIHGRYRVTVDDVVAGARHEDAVCRVTFPVDVHTATGFGNAGVEAKPYDIPLRALIAKDVDGLFLAGRCISGDFLAHASYRVTGNAVAMGEAAGQGRGTNEQTMNLSTLDLIIIGASLALVVGMALYMQRYMRSVVDFLAAGRIAGRYLLCTATMESLSGVVGIVAFWEVYSRTGPSLQIFGPIRGLIGLILGIVGFVTYRRRESRVLTLAQLFEVRYSKAFRVFSGVLIFLAGIINFGIFPAVGARFFVYFCGLPTVLYVAGLSVPTTAVFMAMYLSVCLYFTLTGGQITIMVTDCLEGLISGVLYLVIAVTLIALFNWRQLMETFVAAPAGQSFVQPFDVQGRPDFDLWYVLVGWALSVYVTGAWQGQQGFGVSAKSPHEQRMAGILGMWREFGKNIWLMSLAMAGLIVLNHPDFHAQAQHVAQTLAGVDNPAVVKQIEMPTAFGLLLPSGVRGALVAVMIFGLLANDSSMMHSFGSIFIQDVILPFRKKQLDAKQHIRLLRWAIFGVAVYAFLFSLVYRQTEYIVMFQVLTASIYTAGAGAVIIGGLYWKKGTTTGAWAAMIVGSGLAIGCLLLQQFWKTADPALVNWFGGNGAMADYLRAHADKFPLNGQYISLLAASAATLAYIIGSLLTPAASFDMDRMLHRGKYRIEKPAVEAKPGFSLAKFIGIDAEFTPRDKAVALLNFFWGNLWAIISLGIILWNIFLWKWPARWFAAYYGFYGVVIVGIVSVVTTIWLSIGTAKDLIQFIRDIKAVQRNDADDGSVVNHHNVGE